jgi:hypothetical protein
VGPVDEFPDEGGDNAGVKAQAVFEIKGGDVLNAKRVGAVALSGHVQEGGHDVRHYPVDVETQPVDGNAAGRKFWRRIPAGHVISPPL